MTRTLLNLLVTAALTVLVAVGVDYGANRIGVGIAQAEAQNAPALFDAGVGSGSSLDTGSGSAGSGSDVVAVVIPPDKSVSIDVHDPVTDTQGAISEVKAAKKHGWPFLIITSLIMLAKALQTIGKRWPTIKWIAWLNTGFRAAVITGIIAIGSSTLGALLDGSSWLAVAYAAAGSVLLLINPSPLPSAPDPNAHPKA